MPLAFFLQAATVATDAVTQAAPQATQVIVEKAALGPLDTLINTIISQGPYAALLFLFLYLLWRQYQKLEDKYDALQTSKDAAIALKEEEKTKLRTELSVSEHKLAGMTQQAVNSFQTVGWALQDIRDDFQEASEKADQDRNQKVRELEKLVRESTEQVLRTKNGN